MGEFLKKGKEFNLAIDQICKIGQGFILANQGFGVTKINKWFDFFWFFSIEPHFHQVPEEAEQSQMDTDADSTGKGLKTFLSINAQLFLSAILQLWKIRKPFSLELVFTNHP